MIVFSLLCSFAPSYFLGSWVLNRCDSNGDQACSGPIFWMILPLLFPLFILSFSAVVVVSKLALIGTYYPQQFDLLSWRYLRWWFVDRAVVSISKVFLSIPRIRCFVFEKIPHKIGTR